MAINWGEIKDALGVVFAIWAVLSSAGLWWLSRQFASKGEVEGLKKKDGELEKRIGATEEEVTAMKARMESLPDHEDFAEMKEKLANVDGSVKVAAAEIRGLKDVMQRIEQPLNLLVEHHLRGASR